LLPEFEGHGGLATAVSMRRLADWPRIVRQRNGFASDDRVGADGGDL
jgi:hypothetical protein